MGSNLAPCAWLDVTYCDLSIPTYINIPSFSKFIRTSSGTLVCFSFAYTSLNNICLNWWERLQSQNVGSSWEMYMEQSHGTFPSNSMPWLPVPGDWDLQLENAHTPQHVSVWECVFTCVHTCVPMCIWECASEHIPSKASASVACSTLLGPSESPSLGEVSSIMWIDRKFSYATEANLQPVLVDQSI